MSHNRPPGSLHGSPARRKTPPLEQRTNPLEQRSQPPEQRSQAASSSHGGSSSHHVPVSAAWPPVYGGGVPIGGAPPVYGVGVPVGMAPPPVTSPVDVVKLQVQQERLQETVDELLAERHQLNEHVTQLHKRINGYQHLGQLYHERKREADHYKAECARMQEVSLTSLPPLGAEPFLLEPAPPPGVQTVVDKDATPVVGMKDSPVAETPTTSGTYAAIHRLEESLTNWSMPASSAGEMNSAALTSGSTMASSSDLEGVEDVMTWMCRSVGLTSVSPLALVLIQAVLSVLAKEREIAEQQEGETTSPSRGSASTPAVQQQQTANVDYRLATAVNQLKEQEKGMVVLQQQVRKLGNEKRELEMNQRLWLIEKECLNEQLRSLKQDMTRRQQENAELRSCIEAMHNDASLVSGGRDARRDVASVEAHPEVALLQHQLSVYREDFERERQDRERVTAEKAQLQAELMMAKSEAETKTQQLLSKETEHGALLERFNSLSHEYCARIAEWARIPTMPQPGPPPSEREPHRRVTIMDEDGWHCQLCTYKNPVSRAACRMCNTPRAPQRATRHCEHGALIAHGGRIECDTGRRLSSDLPSVVPDPGAE